MLVDSLDRYGGRPDGALLGYGLKSFPTGRARNWKGA